MNIFHSLRPGLAFAFGLVVSLSAQEKAPLDPPVETYRSLATPAPAQEGLFLKKGDRLAICGDSITEQKQYSLLMEMYLTVCVPQLEISCRQHGWSGERASGFTKRMMNDVLRFKPTVATSCYGMNDHQYIPYTDAVGLEYRTSQAQVAETFKAAGVRYLIGAPGTIRTVPKWVKSAQGTWQDLNTSLLRLRNIDVELAKEHGLRFGDTWWTMMEAGQLSRSRHGEAFKLEGGDGVHPGWAGQAVMAYSFLNSLGLSGDLAAITWDAVAGQAKAEGGVTVTAASKDEISVQSQCYPILPGPGNVAKDDNLLGGFALVPFMQNLNRYTLKVTGLPVGNHTLTWGEHTATFSSDALAAGINLAEKFSQTPLDASYQEVWKAIAAKQAYETRQMKELMHGPEGKADMDGIVAVTEKARQGLVERVRKTFKPVGFSLKLAPAKS